jgi:hypothetical protein
MGISREWREGEERVFAQMDLETYKKVQQDIAEEMEITIRVKNCEYKNDPKHCALLIVYVKAKKALEKREFEINNKNK